MEAYDEPIAELELPTIILDRLERAGVKMISQASAWLVTREPKGIHLDPQQVERLDQAIDDWRHGR